MNSLEILYVNLGDNVPYTYDKIAGRVLGWAKKGNNVSLLVPQLSMENIQNEIVEKNPKKIHTMTLPFTGSISSSPIEIISSYFLRILFSPILLFQKMPIFDVAVSNSAFFVDIFPILILKLAGRCRHWVLIMDSLVPSPQSRTGNRFVNHLTYVESMLVGKIANLYADIILTVNPELKKLMVRRGLDESKIHLTKNGLFTKDIDQIKRSLSDKSTAVYQGRISSNKGIFDLIEVWERVVKKIPKAKLIIMGTGLNESVIKMKREITRRGLDNNISYLGFTAKPRKYEVMKGSQLFLYLSKVNADESWGISLMEGLACGLPAICYDLPIYKYIYNTEGVITVKNGDIDMVAQKTIELIMNKNRTKRLSRESALFARKFDWNIIAERDLLLLNGIMKDENKNRN